MAHWWASRFSWSSFRGSGMTCPWIVAAIRCVVSRTRTLEQVAETLGKAAEETVADTGYWSGAELQEAE